MTGRENYIRAIECRNPQYLPTLASVQLDWLYDKTPAKQARLRELMAAMPDDLMGNIDSSRGRYRPTGQKQWTDEWGTVWLNEGNGAITIGHPLEESFDLMAKMSWPDPCEPGRYDAADKMLSARGDRYTRPCVWAFLFERMWMLRGFDNVLMDPYIYPDEFVNLRDRIVEIELGFIDHWVSQKVDGIFFSDDWGTQIAMLMSPDDWRKFYLPVYKKLFRRIRDGGAHVWMHSCGHIRPVIGDLIDAGMNVLNPIQPQAMDVKELAREFGGKLCFFGGIDSQGVVINGTPDDVRGETRRIVDLLGGRSGGYIGAPSQSIMPETPLDNVIALFETLAEYQRR